MSKLNVPRRQGQRFRTSVSRFVTLFLLAGTVGGIVALILSVKVRQEDGHGDSSNPGFVDTDTIIPPHGTTRTEPRQAMVSKTSAVEVEAGAALPLELQAEPAGRPGGKQSPDSGNVILPASQKPGGLSATGRIVRERTVVSPASEGSGDTVSKPQTLLVVEVRMSTEFLVPSEDAYRSYKTGLSEGIDAIDRNRLFQYPVEDIELQVGDGTVLPAHGLIGEGFLGDDETPQTFIGKQEIELWISDGEQTGLVAFDGFGLRSDEETNSGYSQVREFALAFPLEKDQNIPPFHIRFDGGGWVAVPDKEIELPKLPIKPFVMPTFTMPKIDIPKFTVPPVSVPNFGVPSPNVGSGVPVGGSGSTFRKWKDLNGRVMEAAFVRVSGNQVVFEKRDGKNYRFPMDQLSTEDRAQIEKMP